MKEQIYRLIGQSIQKNGKWTSSVQIPTMYIVAYSEEDAKERMMAIFKTVSVELHELHFGGCALSKGDVEGIYE